MVSLVMVMFDELVDELAYMSLAKRDHATETLLFDRADEPLGIGVEIGTLRWQPNRLDTATRQDLAEDTRVQGIAVVDQMGRGPQTALHRVVAGSDDGEVGEDVLQQVPELSDLPVIFISAYGRDETVARALESGAADYIVKPFLADGTGGTAPRRAATA